MYNYIIFRSLWNLFEITWTFVKAYVFVFEGYYHYFFFHIKIKVKRSLQFTSNKRVVTPAQYITLIISTQSRDHRLKQRFWNVSALKRAILWVSPRTIIVTPTTATTITTSTFLTLNHRQDFVWAHKLNVLNKIYIIIVYSVFITHTTYLL